jgi:general secretion pathway protein A
LLLLIVVLFLLSAPVIYLEKDRIGFDFFRLRKTASIRAVPAGISKPVPLPTLEKPATLSTEETRVRAFGALAERWGIPFRPSPGRDICQGIEEFGLRCLSGKGGLTDLKQLNKPAVLTLRNERGEAYFAALLSLEGDLAAFALGEGIRKVSLEEMETKWQGAFTLFWKPPPGYSGKGGADKTGALRAWLDQKLGRIRSGLKEGGDKASLIKERQKALRAFQVSAGLVPDGVAGPRTLIALADAAGDGGPTLIEKTGRP